MSQFNEEQVKQIIVSGIENGAEVDAIKLEMFKAGVPFDKINPLYKSTAIDAGLMADPKVVKKALADAISLDQLEGLEEWNDVRELAEQLTAEIDGATVNMAIGTLRAQAKEYEVEFPVKPKSSGARGFAGSVIKSLIVDTLNANPEIDSYELFDLIIEKVTGDYRVRNALEYFNMYAPVVLAGKHGVSLGEVKMGLLDKNVLETKYGGTTSYTKKATQADAVEDDADEAETDEEYDVPEEVSFA